MGDALGFITEFIRNRDDIRRLYRTEIIEDLTDWSRPTRVKGKLINLPLPRGTYSDDTQLTLATARGIAADGTFDVVSFSKLELPLWLHYALGAGSGTKAAARNLCTPTTAWHSNFYSTKYSQYVNSGGNGAAMRILPIALVSSKNPDRRATDVWRNAVVTHGHLRGIMGAILFADAIASLLDRPSSKFAWLDALIDRSSSYDVALPAVWSRVEEFHGWVSRWEAKVQQPFDQSLHITCVETTTQLQMVRKHIKDASHKEILSQLGCYARSTKGAGNSTVAAAILFLCRHQSIEEALVTVVNEIGIDTDTIGYFVGAMFGAYYGQANIPEHFANGVRDEGYISATSDWCYNVYIGTAETHNQFSYPTLGTVTIPKEGENLIDPASALSAKVTIPVLGEGTIVLDEQISDPHQNEAIIWKEISLSLGQSIHLQLTSRWDQRGIKPRNERESVNNTKVDESVMNSLLALDQYKDRVERSLFRGSVVLDVIRDMKFSKRDKALYNAFSTWLWTAIPTRDDTLLNSETTTENVETPVEQLELPEMQSGEEPAPRIKTDEA